MKIINVKSLICHKFYILSFLIFIIISNTKILNQENKFNTLYKDVYEVDAVATVISNGTETKYKKSYVVRIEYINNNKKYRGSYIIIYTQKNINLKYGNKVRFTGMYEKAKTATNYKAFNYMEYLKMKNIYGIVNTKSIITLKEENIDYLSSNINKLKSKIKNNLKEILEEKSEIAIGILLRGYF